MCLPKASTDMLDSSSSQGGTAQCSLHANVQDTLRLAGGPRFLNKAAMRPCHGSSLHSTSSPQSAVTLLCVLRTMLRLPGQAAVSWPHCSPSLCYEPDSCQVSPQNLGDTLPCMLALAQHKALSC